MKIKYLVLILFFFVLITPSALAATRTVCPGGGCNFENLTDAFAVANASDIFEVRGDINDSPVLNTGSITLRCMSSPRTMTGTFTINASSFRVDGPPTNAYALCIFENPNGTAIDVIGGQSWTSTFGIYEATIRNSYIGLNVQSGDIAFREGNISNNSYGVMVTNGSHAVGIRESWIYNNSILGLSINNTTDSGNGRIFDNFISNPLASEGNVRQDAGSGNIWNRVGSPSAPNIIGGPQVGGNYWSDYNGVNNFSSDCGIGSSSYSIAGNAGRVDTEPLLDFFIMDAYTETSQCAGYASYWSQNNILDLSLYNASDRTDQWANNGACGAVSSSCERITVDVTFKSFLKSWLINGVTNSQTKQIISFNPIDSTYVRFVESHYAGSNGIIPNIDNKNLTNFNATITYTVDNVAGSTPSREYILKDDIISLNINHSYNLYTLDPSESTYITLTVVDFTGTGVPEALLKFSRYYPSDGTYTMVAMGETDGLGNVVIPLKAYTTFYQPIIVPPGLPSELFSSMKISCTNCIVFTLGTQSSNFLAQYVLNLEANYTFNTSSELLMTTLQDKGGLQVGACLKTYFKNSTTGMFQAWNQTCGTGNVINLNEQLNDTNTTLFKFELFANTTGFTDLLILSGYIDQTVVVSPLGTEGALLSLFIIVPAIGVGLWNPGVAVVMTTFSMLMMGKIGVLAMGEGIIMGLVVISLLLLWKLKS